MNPLQERLATLIGQRNEVHEERKRVELELIDHQGGGHRYQQCLTQLRSLGDELLELDREISTIGSQLGVT